MNIYRVWIQIEQVDKCGAKMIEEFKLADVFIDDQVS